MQGRTFRKDIQGLRALAVLLVLLYHARVPGLGGGFVGVDVFFVLSGYLITGLLVAELAATNRIDIIGFYARRARRLLPASFTVLAFVASIVFIAPRWIPQLVLPQLFGKRISWDIQRSSLYVSNWLFADRAEGYHGSETFGTPVLHFWSLSVEEQFYAVWPILFAAVALLSTRSTRALTIVVSVITVASLAHSIHYSAVSPTRAYFVTTTRIWEMAVGGLLALAAPRLLATLAGRPAVGATLAKLGPPIGLLCIVGSAIVYSADTAYPGSAALVPTLATALLLFLGSATYRPAGWYLLEARPMQWLGSRSYSIYLWHWPALWLATSILGPLDVPTSVAVAVASLLPAELSYRFIETPFRKGNPARRPLLVLAGAGATTALGFAIGAVLLSTTTSIRPAEIAHEPVVTEVAGIQLHADEIYPDISQLRNDVPVGYSNGCFLWGTDDFYHECHVGPENPAATIIVVGNSFTAHWAPALDDIAERNDWRLVYVHHDACRLTAERDPEKICGRWLQQLDERFGALVTETDAAAIVTSTPGYSLVADGDQRITSSYEEAHEDLQRHNVPVVLIKPTPKGKQVGVDCPTLLFNDLGACAVERDAALAGAEPVATGARKAGSEVVDMTRYFCDDEYCPVVVDGLWVRKDDGHMSATFARALSRPLERELIAAVPELAG